MYVHVCVCVRVCVYIIPGDLPLLLGLGDGVLLVSLLQHLEVILQLLLVQLVGKDNIAIAKRTLYQLYFSFLLPLAHI